VHKDHTDHRVGLVLVGFSPVDRLVALARHLGWPGRVLGDPDRQLYDRLGIGRAPLWRVYSPATLVTYAGAVLRRQQLSHPVEDTRQLGGDAVMLDGVVRALWRPRTPNDRPAARAVLDAATSVRTSPHDEGLT
jgi:hypothetical protein